jgi:ribosomal protein S18 acetylase RimI-like enzyme
MSEQAGVVIRAAGAADAKLLAELGARLFEETFGAANTAENMKLYLTGAFSEELQRAELADESRDAWLALSSDATPVAYAMMRRGTLGDGVVFRRPAEVQRIYVDLRLRGTGVGQALMRTCMEEARSRGCDGVWLGVWEENPRAIGFYRRMGFRVVGSAVFLLGRDVQKDLVMAVEL